MIVILLKILTYLVMLGICVCFFLIISKIGKSAEGAGRKATESIDDVFKKRGLMDKYKTTLSKQGIMYRVGNYDMNPSWYVCARLGVGVLLGLLMFALTGNGILFLPGIVLGFIATGMYFKAQNQSDNKAMMMDLYNTYANLKIQMSSGVYLTESLEYSHKVAQNDRYREALGELILNLSDKTISMQRSVEIFKDRFDSREIDKLCALLHNCVVYGISDSYANDIMGEIQGIILASTLESEHDIESKAGMVNFIFFALIIALVGYTVFTNFSGLDLFF